MEKDKINFMPHIWGGSAWKFLHIIALSYPNNPSSKDKENYKNFLLNLQNVLPCQKCCDHFRKNVSKYNINNYLSDPHKLFSWVVTIQNEVQKSLNKPLYNELKLREKYYKQNDIANSIFNIPYKYKNIIFILIAIGVLYGISKIKITIKK